MSLCRVIHQSHVSYRHLVAWQCIATGTRQLPRLPQAAGGGDRRRSRDRALCNNHLLPNTNHLLCTFNTCSGRARTKVPDCLFWRQHQATGSFNSIYMGRLNAVPESRCSLPQSICVQAEQPPANERKEKRGLENTIVSRPVTRRPGCLEYVFPSHEQSDACLQIVNDPPSLAEPPPISWASTQA